MLKDEESLNILRERGVSVDRALERMKGNENAYRKFVSEFFEDPDFESLEKAIETGDVTAAFDCAHGLKGMAANLGLDEICHRLSVLVEILRTGCSDGTSEAFEEVMSAVAYLLK